MTPFLFSISVLCLAAINNEQLNVAPQELIASKFQEQFTGNFQRIRKILLRESRYQRTILRTVAEQPRRFSSEPRRVRTRVVASPEIRNPYPHLLVLASRPIRAPSA